MPDVGILNLQIHDNSSTAAEGLGRLATKLEAVKNATSGIHLGSVATGVARLNEELKKVQPSAIFKLSQLANVLERIGNISGNVGGIRISFGNGNGQSADEISASMKEARDVAAQATSQFSEMKQMAQEVSAQDEAIAKSTESVQQAVSQLDFSVFDPSKLPLEALGMKLDESSAETYHWRDAVVDSFETVERMKADGVSNAVQEVKTNMQEAETAATQTAEGFTAVGSSIQEVNSAMQESANAGKELDHSAEFEATKQSAIETKEAVDEYDAAIEAARKWNKGNNFQAVGQETEDVKYINSLIESASKADLVGMRIDALRDKLYAMANSGKANGDQIARMVMQIQKLQEEKTKLEGTSFGGMKDELDGFNDTAEETKRSLSEIMFGADGLRGAFKRMFPTLSGLLGRFKQLVKYRILRTIVKEIGEGLKEGTENYYNYSKAIGGEFANSMDIAASSLLQMKNSIGAAAAPLISSLIPLLNTVVSLFVTAINYINQFLSLLGGKGSWSKATEQTATAFDNTKKAAGGAGKAIKDLLADWDELNIIQSQNSGGGGGGGAGAVADYASMFEEVSEYEGWIKDTVDWIQEHMDSVLGIAEAIGVAILGWKLSNTFGGALGELGKLITQGAIIAIGLQITYEGAYEAGYKGEFDAKTLIMFLGGVMLTSVTSALVGFKLAGPWGAIIGGTAGLVVSLATAIYAYDKGERQRIEESKWGSIKFTAEEIEQFAKEQFTFDIDAEISVAKAFIKNSIAARAAVGIAIYNFKQSLQKAELINVDAKIDVDTLEGQKRIAALKKAADDAYATIESVKALIAENQKGIEFTLTNFKFTDEGGEDISGELLETLKVSDKTLQEYFTGIGEDIAGWIYKGEQSGWANGEYQMALELMQSQERILSNAEELKNKKLYEMTTDENIQKARNAYAVQDYDTAKGIMEAEKARFEDYYKTAAESVEEEKNNLIYLASLATSAKDELSKTLEKETDPNKKVEIKAKIAELEASAANYETLAQEISEKFDEKIEAKVKDSKNKQIEAWTNMLREVYGEDYASRLAGSMNQGGSWFDWLDDLFGVGHGTDDYIRKALENGGIDEAAKEMYDIIYASMSGVDSFGATKFFVETLGGNLYDLIKNNEALVQNIADGLVESAGDSDIAFEIFKAMFKVDDAEVSKYIQKNTQDVWKNAQEEIKDNAPDLGNVGEYTVKFDGKGGREVEYIDKGSLQEAKETVDNAVAETKGTLETLSQDPVKVAPPDMSDFKEAVKAELAEEEDVNIWELGGVPEDGVVVPVRFVEEEEDVSILDLIGGVSEETVPEVDFAVEIDPSMSEPVTAPPLDSSAFTQALDAMTKYTADSVATIQRYLDALNTLTSAASFFGIPIPTFPVQPKASGGPVRSGDLVMANENGNFEMMGRMGNQPVVANNQQIVQGISSGVAQANGDVVGELRTLTGLMQRMLQKEFVAKAVPGSGWARMNDTSNAAYSNISGNA